MSGYSGTPLIKKLGIQEEFRMALVGAPKGFHKRARFATRQGEDSVVRYEVSRFDSAFRAFKVRSREEIFRARG